MKQRLDRRVVLLWRLQGGVRMLFPLLPVVIGSAMLARDAFGDLLTLFFAVSILALSGLKALFWPSLVYRFYAYEIREEDLWIGRGVLFRRETVIPLSRIQHVDTRQGPLEQLFGLARILVYTASGRVPDGGVPGLELGVASSLRDQLARVAGKDDGV